MLPHVSDAQEIKKMMWLAFSIVWSHQIRTSRVFRCNTLLGWRCYVIVRFVVKLLNTF